ncbi:asparaginase [Salinicoccus hispanicus]|uniref:Asparaginase n=1 Tax=Salinicoccus hispanicus TaxID=157225 RepID=A0A6N8TZQ1_9STAP|nr:asparaginase [Salinicoccus hispanicus]MXQ51033.1 asparaginase [Salinicoccus hispanicus]
MEHHAIAIDYRNGLQENVHTGSICIIDENHELIYSAGDIHTPLFYRSAMKPIQAVPVFKTDIIEKYNLTNQEAALFIASQRGESYHETSLNSVRVKMMVDENELVCAKSYPLNESPKVRYIKEGKEKRKLMHNCAGKHLGFMGFAKMKGIPSDGYESMDHPIQQEILHSLSELAEVKEEDIISGVDGCGVPVHAVPLQNMAISYMKFADPEKIESNELRNSVEKIVRLMSASPEIIASENFICTVLLEDDNIVAKGGAEGVYCLALKREKISIALKVLSGSERVWPILVAKLLEKINYSNEETISSLKSLDSQYIRNDFGEIVGETKINI